MSTTITLTPPHCRLIEALAQHDVAEYLREQAAFMSLLTRPAKREHAVCTGRRNPANSGIRADTAGFLCPTLLVGRGREHNTRKGNTVRRLFAVSNLPTPMGAARRNVSPWSLDQTGDVVMASAIAHHASRITPDQLTTALNQLEALGAHMNALGELFRLIGEHTTGYAVVHPMAEVGQKVADNLTEDLYAILNNVGELSAAKSIPAHEGIGNG